MPAVQTVSVVNAIFPLILTFFPLAQRTVCSRKMFVSSLMDKKDKRGKIESDFLAELLLVVDVILQLISVICYM